MRFTLVAVVWGLALASSRLTEPVLVKWNYMPATDLKVGALLVVPHDERIASVYLAGRRLSYLKNRQLWIGIVPKEPVLLAIQLHGPNIAGFAEYTINADKVPLKNAAPLRLPSSVWQRVSDQFAEERARDRAVLFDHLNQRQGSLLTACWRQPLASPVTSPFASARELPNGTRYYHSGEDRRARSPTPILAIGPGRVVLASSMIVPGLNVMIDHGDGWYSRYLHLSSVQVKPGDQVQGGEPIGLSGASGRVEAPHLHWEIVWQGIPGDPSEILRDWQHLCEPGAS